MERSYSQSTVRYPAEDVLVPAALVALQEYRPSSVRFRFAMVNEAVDKPSLEGEGVNLPPDVSNGEPPFCHVTWHEGLHSNRHVSATLDVSVLVTSLGDEKNFGGSEISPISNFGCCSHKLLMGCLVHFQSPTATIQNGRRSEVVSLESLQVWMEFYGF